MNTANDTHKQLHSFTAITVHVERKFSIVGVRTGDLKLSIAVNAHL
jgi:hypothetical protein